MEFTSKQIMQIEVIKLSLEKELGAVTDKEAIDWAITFSSQILEWQLLNPSLTLNRMIN